MKWNKIFKINPIPILLNSNDKAIIHFTKKELEGKRIESVKIIWKLPEVEKILRKQQKDGSWKYPNRKDTARERRNYAFLETYRQIRYLIEMYGLNKSHPSIKNAAKFLLSFQSQEGDLRGIYGNQYSPNYSAAAFELLIKSGYKNDKKILKGLDWLTKIRQDDGGWALAFRTKKTDLRAITNPRAKTIQPDRSKPSSHLITDPVLRALSLHPKYKKRNDKSRRTAKIKIFQAG